MDSPITGWRRFLSMEPLAFALMFSFSISDTVLTDLIIYRTCKTTGSINDTSKCDILHKNSSSKEAMDLEKLFQQHTGLIFALKSCLDTIFPTILSLFLGPWSDKNGRKPLLIYPFLGSVIYYTLIAILSNFNINPYWYLLPSIPATLFGGFPAILIIFFCYTTDITDNKNRAWHLACLHMTIYAGILAGLLISPIVFRELGYGAVFSISAITSLLAVLHSIFFVKETVQTENERTLSSIFDSALVKELFSVVAKKRDGFDRLLVWSCITAIALHVVILEGNSSVSFLFASSKLGWNISHYSIYSGTSILVSIFGTIFIIQFAGSILNFPDTVIVIISCLSNAAGNLIRAFAQKPWHMFLSAGVGMFSSAAIPVIRAIVSKSVSQKDVGKIFSLTTTVEMTIPFITTPLYIFIYSDTLNQFPCPVWFLSTVFPVIMIILIIIVEKRWRLLKNTQYVPFVSDTN